MSEDRKPTTVFDFLGTEGQETAKALAKANGVNVPVLLARMALHVMAEDNVSEIVADLCSDAPKAGRRGRGALTPEEKAARQIARVLGKTGTDLASLQARIDSIRKA